MSIENKTIWFPAKRYGWGWGPPSTWQGWLVLAAYVVLLTVGSVYFLKREMVLAFIILTLSLTGGLMLVCWIKGEKPEWRWGPKS